MKFTVDKEALVAKLNLLPSLPSNIVPILNTVLIDAGEVLNFSATDSIIFTNIEAEGNIKETGRACVPVRNFVSLVKEMPSGELTIETTKAQLHIKNGSVKLRMNMFEASEFPLNKAEEGFEHEIEIAPEELASRLRVSAIAMGSTIGFDVNAMLMMVGEDITFVATDGKRLAVSTGKGKTPDKYLVPARAVTEIIKIAEASEETVTLSFKKGCLFLESDAAIMTSRLLEDKYPDYTKFIPEESKVKLTFNRLELAQALKRTEILTNDVDNPLKVMLSSDKMELTRRNASVGDIEEALKAEYKGEEIQMGFEVKCLLDVLNILPKEKVTADVYASDKPLVVREKDYLYLTLPIIL